MSSNLGKKKRVRPNRENKPFEPNPNAVRESEIGVCSDCDSYRRFRPHTKLKTGEVAVTCKKVNGKIRARTDICSPSECNDDGRERRRVNEIDITKIDIEKLVEMYPKPT